MSYRHLRDTTPKARKPHKCYLCGDTIATGRTHVHRVSVNEGRLDSIRMHTRCEAGTADWDSMNWECFSEGDMETEMHEAEKRLA